VFFSGFRIGLAANRIKCFGDIKGTSLRGSFEEEVFKEVGRSGTHLILVSRTSPNPPAQCQ